MRKVASSIILTLVVMAAMTGVGARAERSAHRILGTELRITKCQARPNSGVEWKRYASCQNRNMASIRRWGERLDRCIAVLAVQTRNDDAYYVDGSQTTQGNGLSLWDGTGPRTFALTWRDIVACPRS
jgi:hypothetical protein